MGIFGAFKKAVNPFEFLREVGAELFVSQLKGEEGKKQVRRLLRTGIGGFGEVDEVLTLSAITKAEREGWISSQEAKNFYSVLKALPRDKRNKITNIIGHSEQEVRVRDAQGNERVVRENRRGAEIVTILAKKDKKEVLAALEAIGGLDTPFDGLRDVKKWMDQNAHKALETTKKLIPRQAKRNWLGRLAKKMESQIQKKGGN